MNSTTDKSLGAGRECSTLNERKPAQAQWRFGAISAGRIASIVIGLLLVLFGSVFALQGANVITGSALMSGNSTYIYVGAALVLIGLILLVFAKRTGSMKASTTIASTNTASQT